MGVYRILGRLVRKQWAPEQVAAMVGPWQDTWLAHASNAGIRGCAASGGVVSALLIDQLEQHEIDGAVVCSTVIEDHKVRACFSIATTAEEVLAARGSTYVTTRFARDALPLIEAFDGRLAVVGLPCDLTLLERVRAGRPQIDKKIALTVGLMCGHASQPELVDAIVRRLEREADGRLETFRFRVGHWRGQLRATFDNEVKLDKPFSAFSLYQNLYFFADKRCLYCGDHFAYDADIVVGDVWRPELKDDPIKHSSVLVRTDTGRAVLEAAAKRDAIDRSAMGIADLVEGQARTAPFHYNVSARAKAAARYGIQIPDKIKAPVKWYEYLAARIVLSNWRRSQTGRGAKTILRTPRVLHKLQLYFLKALETLPGSVVENPDAEPTGPNVAIIAGTIGGNRGAEAMLTTCIGQVRERFPNSRFFAYSYYPESDRRLNHDLTVKVHSSTPTALVLLHFPFALLGALWRLLHLRPLMRLAPASVRDLGRCDVLLDVAGVSFIDGREKFLPFNVLTVWPAMLLGVPVVKMSQAMGPFSGGLNRFAARRILPRCSGVFARGDSTLENLRELDLGEPPLNEAADIAFLHETTYALSAENPDHLDELLAAMAEASDRGRKIVGLCPSSVVAAKAAKRGESYPDALARFVESTTDAGHTVLLFPNATRESSGEKLRNNDLPVIAAVMERLDDKTRDSGALIAVTHDLNTASIKELIAACDVTLVSRFHAMVGALSSAVPVGVIGWSHKYLEVMEQFGLGEMVLDHTEGDPEALQALLGRLLKEQEQLAATIGAKLPSVRASSAGQFEHVAKVLDG